VLITSRERKWAEIAAPVEVDVLARPESVALLQSRVAGLSEADADQLAGQLGDLPLAIAQAGGFMAETGMPATQLPQAAEHPGRAAPSAWGARVLPAVAGRCDPADR
jgi:hypothetical protein